MTSAERHEARYRRRKAAREAKRRKKLDRYDSFLRVTEPAALLRANWDSRQGVTFKASVARYDAHAYRNSFLLSRDLRSEKKIHEGFYAFTVVERGKTRQIHSLHYRERVVRRSVCINALVPILSANLIYDNGASLRGKGVSFSADRCETHLHRYFRETGTNVGWVILIDFKGYFDNILHAPLFDIFDRYLHDERLNRLCRSFVSCTDDDRPPEQRGKGLYIGPEDSQIYAVAYPNRIDHKIKDGWRVKYYGRYMDDSYLIVRTKDEARTILDALLREYAKLGIVVSPKKTRIQKLEHGFTFLKTRYILTETGRVIRKPDRTGITRERRKLKRQYKLVTSGVMNVEGAAMSYMSWRGATLARDAYRTVRNMDTLFYKLFGVKPWIKNTHRRYFYESYIRRTA